MTQGSDDQAVLRRAIEAAFARADRRSLRAVTRELEGLIGRVEDPRLRARYEGALDALSEMVRHDDGGA
ncbi:MAG: hypothetical protein VKQ33_14235 [Candidatus Sericytochromatia bacterium]|nr:hypothetical protein [Candidatus Sericytochromatia bacterium]